MIFAHSDYADSWQAVRRPGHRIDLYLPDMMPELAKLAAGLPSDPTYPYVLSAGERRSDTSNTSIRDPGWHKKGQFGTLRIHPKDAASLGCAEGDWVRLTTRRGSAETLIELSDGMQLGHVSLPNGHGIDYRDTNGVLHRKGVSLNELTDTDSRDVIAGTPWHKHVPLRIERIDRPQA